jgi:hypothetical protein
MRRTLVLILLSMALAGAADARQETFHWTHPLGSQVASFHIYVGSAPGASDLVSQDVGVPAPDASGIYSITLDVPSTDTVYVRTTAIDASALESAPSNEIARDAPLGVPGRPVVVTP